jgi:hypothetical protein
MSRLDEIEGQRDKPGYWEGDDVEWLLRVARAAERLMARIDQGVMLARLDDVRDTWPLCDSLRRALEGGGE